MYTQFVKQISSFWVPVHQFECFFFNWLKISHRFHFFVLDHQQMKSDGCTMRTTVRTTVRMNTGRVGGGSRPEIIPF